MTNFGIHGYLATFARFGSDYAYKQAALDLSLNWWRVTETGRDKVVAAMIGFASR